MLQSCLIAQLVLRIILNVVHKLLNPKMEESLQRHMVTYWEDVRMVGNC